jgi:hypothetical protein
MTSASHELKQFTEASRGFMRMAIVAHDDIGLLEALINGNEFAIDCVSAVKETLSEMQKPRKPKPLCLCCDHRFPQRESPSAFLIMLAGAFDGPSHGIASPICDTCYDQKSREQLNAAAIAYVKEVWPNSNPIWVAPGTDRAQ